MRKIVDRIAVEANVRIELIDRISQEVVDTRESHNIITNVGRNWLRDLVSPKAWPTPIPAGGAIEGSSYVYTSERVGYIGFGVGGALSVAPYYHTQEELVGVTAIEDYVMVNATDYLKQIYPCTAALGSFPDSYTAAFMVDVLDSEISFATNTSKSMIGVGTTVPISEIGLYLSGASVTDTPDHVDNLARCIAYNIFSPLNITPDVTIRVVWEFRW